jgi:hypothetical protein
MVKYSIPQLKKRTVKKLSFLNSLEEKTSVNHESTLHTGSLVLKITVTCTFNKPSVWNTNLNTQSCFHK